MKRTFQIIVNVDSDKNCICEELYNNFDKFLTDAIKNTAERLYKDKWGHNISNDIEIESVNLLNVDDNEEKICKKCIYMPNENFCIYFGEYKNAYDDANDECFESQ